jgi:hypothetical protein
LPKVRATPPEGPDWIAVLFKKDARSAATIFFAVFRRKTSLSGGGLK